MLLLVELAFPARGAVHPCLQQVHLLLQVHLLRTEPLNLGVGQRLSRLAVDQVARRLLQLGAGFRLLQQPARQLGHLAVRLVLAPRHFVLLALQLLLVALQPQHRLLLGQPHPRVAVRLLDRCLLDLNLGLALQTTRELLDFGVSRLPLPPLLCE